MDAAHHLRRPTARRVDANNALTWAFAWCPHQSSDLGPMDYHWRVPGRLECACFVLCSSSFGDLPARLRTGRLPSNRGHCR